MSIQKITLILALYLSLVVNCCLSLDLYFILNNPFQQAAKRFSKYLLFTLAFGIVMLPILIKNEMSPSRGIDVRLNNNTLLLLKTVSCILFLITWVSTIMSVSRLGHRGTSKELRKVVT